MWLAWIYCSNSNIQNHPPWTCVCENHLPIHYQALVKTYILENICIICNLFWLILGYTNFQSSRTFAIFSCFIFQDSLPQSMTRVFKLFILFCLSLIILASAPQLYKKICLKCTTNDWRSIFKIALLTSEICLIMTWICKNHFDKFPHFSSLFFSLQQCTKRLRFLNLFPPIFFFFCQQHWQSNLNEILHTDIFLTRENSTKWIGTEKGVLTPIIGRFVCD